MQPQPCSLLCSEARHISRHFESGLDALDDLNGFHALLCLCSACFRAS